MKKRIIIITLVLILAGTAVLGFDMIKLTPEEALEAASQNDLQREIDQLNHELKQINLDKSNKNASYTAINTYQGKLTKYVYPYDAKTSLVVSDMNLERTEKLLAVTILSSMVSLNDSRVSYEDSKNAYEDALAEYNKAMGDSALTPSELLSLEYTAENNRIKMLQTENTLNRKQSDFDNLLGVENAVVEMPVDYRTPYELNADDVFASMQNTDISLYQAKRSLESATLRHEIAEQFFNEDDETFISTLASLKSAELNYAGKLRDLELSALDKVDNMMNMYDSIQLEKLNVELKNELYKASQKQYDAGIISINSLESSEYSYELAKRQLETKINNYIIACLQFEIDTGFTF